jgi:uncharacterized OB-fold protein
MTRPTPDRDSAPWWAALAEHRLLLQRCLRCDTRRAAPRAMCSACGSFEWTWSEASGRGTVVSWTVSHRAFQPGLAAPYVVLLVQLAEGPGLMLPGGWGGGADSSDLSVGLPVRAGFRDLPKEDEIPSVALLEWLPEGLE